MTASDPVAQLKDARALAASDPKIITSVPRRHRVYTIFPQNGYDRPGWLRCEQP